MFRKSVYKRIIICFILAYSIAFLQYTIDRNKYLRLKNNGVIVPAYPTYSKKISGEYANFFFFTKDSVRIERSEKCGNKEMYDREYTDMKVIYNSKDPYEFQN